MSHTSLLLLVEDSADDVLLIRRAFQKANIANPLKLVTSGDEAIVYLSGVGPYANRANSHSRRSFSSTSNSRAETDSLYWSGFAGSQVCAICESSS